MKLQLRIGIIGRGFVGGAIEKFLTENSDHDIESYDIKDGIEANDGYAKIVKHSDIIYLCLPTPMDAEGRCYTGIVREAIRLLSFWARAYNKMPIVLLKSTMTPGTTDELQDSVSNLILVTNPEFLTERQAFEDFKNAKKHVFGLPDARSNPIVGNLKSYHEDLWPDADCIFVEPTQAELIKYLTNCYFSVKVTFANHMHQLCQALGVDYTEFINEAIDADPRIEKTHWQVPGPDGKLGFGGSCFPKDLNGMITLFKDHGVEPYLLEAALAYNNYIRPERDWETLKGRAVLDDNRDTKLLPQTTEPTGTD